MRSKEEKKGKQDNYQPISIKLVLKIALVAVGCMVWGTNFLGVVLAVYLAWGIIKQVLSCLLSLVLLIGLIALLISFII
mgnify:CR=1 FL=1